MNQEGIPIKVEIAHILSEEQLKGISENIYIATLEAIQRARKDSELDTDILFSKTATYEWLGVSYSYFEELLAKGMPKGRMLSNRKQCFSKSAIKKWLLENEEK